MKKKRLKSGAFPAVEKLINTLDDERIAFDFEHRLAVIRRKLDKEAAYV